MFSVIVSPFNGLCFDCGTFWKHVGLFETYRYKRTGQFFYMELYRKLVCFFLNISIIIADINIVQTTLCSEISPQYFDLFSRYFAKKRCRLLRDNRHYPFLYKTENFSEINVSVDA